MRNGQVYLKKGSVPVDNILQDTSTHVFFNIMKMQLL